MHGGLHTGPPPSFGPSGPSFNRQYSDGQNSYYVDSSNHAYSESFEVPKKYLGLLIGKQGEAIKRFRAYASEKGMAIVVNQNSQEAWV